MVRSALNWLHCLSRLARCPSPPLSSRWLTTHCTAAPKYPALLLPGILIFHATSINAAASVTKNGSMFGGDIGNPAHFHTTPGNAYYQADQEKRECMLAFSWNGPQQTIQSTPSPNPGILFNVISGPGGGLWECRLYPGTTSGLSLFHFRIGNSGYYLLKPLNIEIVAPPC